jgi:hypothetical protein
MVSSANASNAMSTVREIRVQVAARMGGTQEMRTLGLAVYSPFTSVSKKQ